jgi:hypothetical protein
LIEAGRVLVGPWFILADPRLVSREAIIRNLAFGHRIARQLGRPFAAHLSDLQEHLGEEPDANAAGVLSARSYIKQANARAQLLLEQWAEPLALFASMQRARHPSEELRHAWRLLLQNHSQPGMGGCAADMVHEENMTRFARAQQVAEGVRDAAIEAIALALPPTEPGAWRCVAFNPGQQPFSGVLDAIVDLPFESAERLVAVDATVTGARTPDGRIVPVQILSEEFVTVISTPREDESPTTVRARRVRVLWNGDVPAFGYAAFDLLLGGDEPAPQRTRSVGAAEHSAENEYLRVLVNDDGTVDVVDRRTATRYPRCGFVEDGGDVGDVYRHDPPMSNLRVTSDEVTDVHIARLHGGPLRAAFRIDYNLSLPPEASGDRSARTADRIANHLTAFVWLDAGSPRLNWEVVVDNCSRDHRLRMLFPLGSEPFSAVRSEPPLIVEAGGAAKGAIVYGIGLLEHEIYPRDEIAGARVGVTLLRCVGQAGPGLSVPGAQCPGTHRFRLAFEPRGAEASLASLSLRATAFSTPPRVVAAVEGTGSAPLAASFLTLETTRGGVVVNACKHADDRTALVVRLSNPDDTPATVRIRASRPVQHACFVDFLEERTQHLAVRDGGVEIALGPRAITTIELEF